MDESRQALRVFGMLYDEVNSLTGDLMLRVDEDEQMQQLLDDRRDEVQTLILDRKVIC